jgi:hypothetical protein
MNRNIPHSLALNICGLGLLAGCNMNPYTAPLAATTGTMPTPSPPVVTTPPPTPPAHIVQPSIFVSQYGQEPLSVLGFAGTASGPNPLYVEVPGWLPAVDAAGISTSSVATWVWRMDARLILMCILRMPSPRENRRGHFIPTWLISLI